MTNEITEIRDAAIIAAEINVIKERTKREVLTASVEIGQKLCEAKELVNHGDWGQWLHDKVDYSQATANNLMRIYKEYGDDQINLLGSSKSQTFKNLSYSQAIALFALPAEEREDFVKENNVEDMSARQLQDAIKEREEAEAARVAAENRQKGTEKLLEKANDDKDRLEQALKKSDEDKATAEKNAADEIKVLQDQLAQAAKPATPSPEEVKKLRAEIRKKVEEEYQKKEQQLTLEKKSAEDKAEEIEKKYQDQLKSLKLDNESILARQQETEKKLALSAPEAQKFSVYFENFQLSLQKMQAAIKALSDSGNTETADKLRGALSKVIASMAESLRG